MLPQLYIQRILTNLFCIVQNALTKINLRTNAWGLIDSELSAFNTLFSFILEACCDPEELNPETTLDMAYYLFIMRKTIFQLII